ncbi:MAG: protein kinase [Gammaproteobacteria bacterium]|nr:protein kinase [Gammaproteobacteria bacterium]
MIRLLTNHRWWIFLLGLALLGWSFLPGAQQLEYALYTRLAVLMPVSDAPVKTVVVTLGSVGQQVSHKKLADLLRRLQVARVKAVGITASLNVPQTLLDVGAQTRLQSLLEKQKTADIWSMLDPDDALRTVLQSMPMSVVLAVPPASALLTSLAVETPDNGLAMLLPVLLPPQFSGMNDVAPVVSEPLPLFAEVATTAAFVGDRQQKVRVAVPLAIAAGQTAERRYFPSFEMRLAAQTLGVPVERITVHPGQGVFLGTTWYATDAGLRVYPQVPDASRLIPVLSAKQVLNDSMFKTTVKKELRGKTVLVGASDGLLTQSVRVPGLFASTGLLWSAQAVNAMMTESFVNVPWWSSGVQRGMLLLIVVYLLLLPLRLRGNLGLLIGVGLVILLLNGNLLLMVIHNTWLPLALPMMFLLLGQSLLWLHHRGSRHHTRLRDERDAALLELSANLRAQGQLDQAMARLSDCATSVQVQEAFYQLGLDFERRRQFNKALIAYDHIAEQDDNFRDIRERRARHQPELKPASLAATSVSYASTRLVVDDPKVERPLLGRYEVESELGRGAMGTVYLGRDPRIGRTVAIKTMALTEEFESEQLEDVRRRFFQEAETAGRLNHPNIVTIYDVGEEHDLAYIAMDYIAGNSLDQHIRKETLLPMAQVFAVGVQVAEALNYAHEHKVVHRDVKPGNIIFDPDKGQLKVTDFGIACLTDNSKTRTGTVLGSPFYMSPEQIAGKKVDGRSDLFSLGVTLYQLFTGRLPFEGDSLTNLMYQITNEKPESIRKLRPELPACVTRFINKALEKDPAKRFDTGQSMADAIRRCVEKT